MTCDESPDAWRTESTVNDITGGTVTTWREGPKYYAADDAEPSFLGVGDTRRSARRDLNAQIRGEGD